jgi:hypothetical protein
MLDLYHKDVLDQIKSLKVSNSSLSSCVACDSHNSTNNNALILMESKEEIKKPE